MTDVEPHAQHQPRPAGWVNCPKCGARTRSGRPCAAPAIQGKKRCRMHGGLSTGPRTKEGLSALVFKNLKHGRRSKMFRAALRDAGIVAKGMEVEVYAQEVRLHAERAGSAPVTGDAPEQAGAVEPACAGAGPVET